MLWTCGCTTGLIILAVAILAIAIKVNQPGPPDIQPLNSRTILPISSEDNPDWAAHLESTRKPIELRLDISTCNLEVTPDGDPGEVTFDGNYDAANYTFESNLEEREDRIIYRVTFKSNKSRSWLWSNDDHNNRIRLKLPPMVPTRVFLDGKALRADLDLTGIPIASFRGEINAGALEVVKRDTNPIETERLDLDLSMGSVRIYDLQNFNTALVRVDASMGDVRLMNSGDFTRDLDINVSASMGDVMVQVPEFTRLSVQRSTSMGSYRGPTSLSNDPSAPRLALNATVSMGSVTVETAVSKPLISKVLFKMVRDEGLRPALKFYDKVKDNGFEGYRREPDALKSLGLHLLDIDQPYDALEVLKRNAAQNPADPASFHALAQAYLAIGDYGRAKEEVLTALEIDPDYEPAARFLRDLETSSEPPPKL